MNPSTWNRSTAGNSMVKVTTLIAVVAAAVMVAAGVYGESVRRRSQVVRPAVQPTVVTTGYFDPCNVDYWRREFPIQVKLQYRQQCKEHRIR